MVWLICQFLHAIGIQSRYQGRTQIKEFYDFVRKLYPDFRFMGRHCPEIEVELFKSTSESREGSQIP
jgi:hypothetical protein